MESEVDGMWTAKKTCVLTWGQHEDRTWFAEYVIDGENRVRLECAFHLWEIRERLAKHGIEKLPRKARVPMP